MSGCRGPRLEQIGTQGFVALRCSLRNREAQFQPRGFFLIRRPARSQVRRWIVIPKRFWMDCTHCMVVSAGSDSFRLRT